jgi:hypothetical protein
LGVVKISSLMVGTLLNLGCDSSSVIAGLCDDDELDDAGIVFGVVVEDLAVDVVVEVEDGVVFGVRTVCLSVDVLRVVVVIGVLVVVVFGLLGVVVGFAVVVVVNGSLVKLLQNSENKFY